MRTRWFAGGLAGLALLAGGGSLAVANTGDDEEGPITGDALEKASAAALAYTGGGSVTDTEVGDEDSYYEVEVTLPDGRQVDVQLDENFQVVGSDDDDEGEHDEDDEEEDDEEEDDEEEDDD